VQRRCIHKASLYACMHVYTSAPAGAWRRQKWPLSTRLRVYTSTLLRPLYSFLVGRGCSAKVPLASGAVLDRKKYLFPGQRPVPQGYRQGGGCHGGTGAVVVETRAGTGVRVRSQAAPAQVLRYTMNPFLRSTQYAVQYPLTVREIVAAIVYYGCNYLLRPLTLLTSAGGDSRRHQPPGVRERASACFA
jgi:hypothetical protein